METNNQEINSKEQKKEGSCCSGRHRHGFWIIKIALIAFILVLIFSIGAGLMKFGRRDHSYKKYGNQVGASCPMLNGDFLESRGKNRISAGGLGMMRGLTSGANIISTDKVFGNISKIEGNKITVTDNSGKEQIVISGSKTDIIAAGGLTSLSSLKTGENITGLGTLSKDGALDADTIRIE